MISKELLSEVLGDKVTFISDDIVRNEILYSVNNYCKVSINIYELAHKCKEWAYDNGYKLKSYKEAICIYECEIGTKMNREGDKKYYIHADTEPEAIFKACQWIMEQKK